MKNDWIRRGISLLLAAVMVFSMVPGRITASAVTTGNDVVDPSTMDTWQSLFPTGNSLSTQNAGMVWTDKSVFTDVPAGLPAGITMADQDDNFLVALSVMASNKTIKGYSTIPTDTVFILDLSSSMTRNGDRVNGQETSAIDDLVVATNAAITRLLALNEHNRVGVVLFAGNTNGNWNHRDAGTVTILPLARYTAGDEGKFLIATNGDNTVEVANNVKQDQKGVSGKKASTSGTFTQDGLYQAMVEFLEADTVIEDGKIQAGTSRKPILVLMSDGEPTMGNPDFDGNFNSTTMTATDLGKTAMSAFNRGGYGEQAAREEIAFVTQLTAMLVNSVVEDHYGQDMLFYTLAYGEEAVTRAEAMSVLNPARECTALNNLWNTLQRDKKVSVFQNLTDSRNSHTKANVNINDYVTPGNEKFEGRVYVDKFYPANTDANFATAFADITNEIILQSQYTPTLVDSGNHDLDGYVSFVDHIGHHMHVTDVKGMVIGNTLFSGATFSEYIVTGKGGSMQNPSALGDEFIRSVKARLGIESTAVAQQLVQQAFQCGQIGWKSNTEFSNYIGWYSDADGKYLGFWDESLTTPAPDGATHINHSYGFLGAVDAAHGVKESDMMYTTVRFRTEIATGDETFAWAIPAALIPTVSYEVELDGDSYDSNMKGICLAEGSATAPIRLLFEVSLDEHITEYNVAQLAPDAYDAATGKYVFYTNDWKAAYADPVNTYAYFEASKQNECYYYTEDTIIYNANGTVYTGSDKPTSGYRAYYVYKSGANRAEIRYLPISADALADAEKSGSNWVIPKGTYYQMLDTRTFAKVDENGNSTNHTGTMDHVSWPVLDMNADAQYHTAAVLGNNGKLTIAAMDSKDVDIEKTTQLYGENGKVVMAGDVLTYRVTFANSHNEAVQAVVTDKIPVGTTYVEGSANLLDGNNDVKAVGVVNGDTITWTVDSMPVNAVYHAVFKVKVTASGTNVVEDIENVATIKLANDPEFNTNPVHNPLEGKTLTDTDGNEIGSPDTVQVGDVLVYRIRFVNDSNAATTVTIQDTIPAGTSYVEGSADHYGVYDANTNTITWEIKDVQPNTPGIVSFRVQVDASAKQNWENGAAQPETGLITIPNQATIKIGINNPVVRQTNIPTIDVPVGDLKLTKNVAEGDSTSEVFKLYITETTGKLNGTYVLSGSSQGQQEITFVNGQTLIKDAQGNIVHDSHVLIMGGETVTLKGIPAGTILSVYEDLTGKKGWTATYDTTVVTITAEGEKTVGVTVNNDYNVKPARLVLEGTKELTGLTLGADQFSFVVKEGDTVVATGENDADGNIIFTPITYTEAGDHTYTITETKGGMTNMKYDATEFTVKVTVTDDNSQLVAAVEYPSTGIVFTNRYEPNDLEIKLNAKKILENHSDRVIQLHEGQFTFIAVDAQGNVVASGRNTADNEASDVVENEVKLYEKFEGDVPLGNFTFHVADMKNATQSTNTQGNLILTKVFEYTAYELIPAEAKNPYMDYSNAQYNIKIEVKYNKTTGSWGTPAITINGVAYDANDTDLVFTNKLYNDHVHVTPAATKTTVNGNAAAPGSSFSFRVDKLVNGEWVERGSGSALASETAVDVTFSNMTITEAGKHYFRIQEANAGKEIHGITYSPDVYLMEVVVVYENYQLRVDENQTKYYIFDANATDYKGAEVQKLAFENTYDAKGSITLTATKLLENRTLNAAEFSFKLVGEDGTAHTGIMDAEGKITFGTLYYSVADLDGQSKKTFCYTMSEVQGKLPGVQYDETKHDVFVTVENDGAGNLNVYLSDKDGKAKTVATDATNTTAIPTGITFKNTYSVQTGATINLIGKKKLTGRPLRDAEFDFGLYGKNSETGNWDILIDVAENDASGNIKLTLDYPSSTTPQTFEYRLREIVGTLGGVTHDKTEYVIKVTVGENQNAAALTVTEVMVGDQVVTATTETPGTYDVTGTVVFNNTYKPEGTSYTPVATKTLTGRDMVDNEFSFLVYEVTKNAENQEILTEVATGWAPAAKNGEAANIVFTPIHYTEVGEHTYVIKEAPGSVGGVDYDDEVEHRFKVTVTDDGNGNLEAKAVYFSGASFRNHYGANAAELTLSALKTLTNKNLQAGEFSFKITQTDAEFKAVENGYTETVKNAADGKIAFSKLTYAAPGTYYYVIEEVAGIDTRYTYDATKYHVAITVTDDLVGNLRASVAIVSNGATVGAVTFANSYTPNPITVDLTDAIRATKKVQYPDGTVPNVSLAGYQFEVVDITGAKVLDKDGNPIVGVSDATGKISFNNFTFKTAGEYHYFIRETGTKPGYIMDTSVWSVCILVNYNAETGELYIDAANAKIYKVEDVQVQAESAAPEFVNIYNPKAVDVTIRAKKTLIGRELKNHEFTFQLVDKDGNVVQSTTNAKDGTVSFSLNYTKTGTYTYSIREFEPTNDEKLGGVIYDKTVYSDITVTVTEEDGKLQADVTGDDVEFKNTYKVNTPAEITISGTKVLTGMDLEAGDFEFVLTDKNNNQIGQSVTNDAEGRFSFPVIKYSGAEAIGQHVYMVYEKKGDNVDITYDKSVYVVLVTVSDNGVGGLTASAVIEKNGAVQDQILFSNRYQKPLSTSVTLTASKTMNNQPAAGYTFLLTDKDHKVLDTATSDAEGKITFKKLDFHAEGTYSYYLCEQAGTDKTTVYDPTEYHVTIEVTKQITEDGAANALVAKTTIKSHTTGQAVENVVFANKSRGYAHVNLVATKILEGALPTEGQFEFVLKDSNGTVVEEVVNKKLLENNVVFKTLEFQNTGVYTYTISEVKGNEPYMVYDETVYTVTVTVTAPQDLTSGEPLHAEVTYKVGNAVADKLTFTNRKVDGGTADFSFRKVAEKLEGETVKHSPLEGATFTLTHINCCGNDRIATMQATSDANGVVTFRGVPSGHTFIMTENTDSNGVVNIGGVDYQPAYYRDVVTHFGKVYVDGVEANMAEDPDKLAVKVINIPTRAARVVLEGVKTLESKENLPVYDGRFKFTLAGYASPDAEVGTLLQTQTNMMSANTDGSQASKVIFDPLTYEQTGKHYYVISETPGTYPGMIYDPTTYYVVVDVIVDPADAANLVANVYTSTEGFEKVQLVEAPDAVTNDFGSVNVTNINFKNILRDPVAVQLWAKKALDGGSDKLAADEFIFHLVDENGDLIAERTNDANGDVFLTELIYREKGVHKFTIHEKVAEGHDHVIYDTKEVAVIVEVVENDKNGYNAIVTYDGIKEKPVFTNRYVGQLMLIKQDDQGKPMAGAAFTLAHKDGCCDTEIEAMTAVSRNDGYVIFTGIPSGHDYILSETKVPAGYVASPDHLVKVEKGETAMYEADGSPLDSQQHGEDGNNIINHPVVEIVLEAEKILEGMTQTAGEFNFTLTEADENFKPLENGYTDTVSNSAEGKIVFGAMQYQKPGIHHFIIREIPGENELYTYDASVYHVTVTVMLAGEGRLAAKVTAKRIEGDVQTDVSAIIFRNVYTPKANDLTLSGHKNVDGRPVTENAYAFQLMDAAGNVIETVKNAADGRFAFSAIHYTEAGIYTYSIREVKGEEAVVTYDETVYEVKVTVVDQNGQLVATPVIAAGGKTVEKINFHNIYTPNPVDLKIPGTKILTGMDLAADAFSFQLKNEAGEILETVKNAADGSFAFSALTFQKAGTYTYTIHEVIGQEANMTYDATVYTVIVTVEDDHKGALTASYTVQDENGHAAEAIVFVNAYEKPSVPPTIAVPVVIHKTVINKNFGTMLPEGFQFKILDEAGKEVDVVTSDVLGFAVSGFEFDHEDAGKTFTYTVYEEDTGKEDVTYSRTVYKVTIAVALDEANNRLETQLQINGTSVNHLVLEFMNIYEPEMPDLPDLPELPEWPTEPAPTEPAPTEPAPTEPVPTEPAPTEPAPTEPAPTEPAPTEPAPTEPAPTEPAPTEPAPTEPAPTEPAPTEPAPTEPKPDTPATGDDSNIVAWGLTMAASLVALVVLLMAKRPKGKYERT